MAQIVDIGLVDLLFTAAIVLYDKADISNVQCLLSVMYCMFSMCAPVCFSPFSLTLQK